MSKNNLKLIGEICPRPLTKTRQALEQMNTGDVLLVKTDSNPGVRNIIKWCDEEGHACELAEAENGLWQITITKK